MFSGTVQWTALRYGRHIWNIRIWRYGIIGKKPNTTKVVFGFCNFSNGLDKLKAIKHEWCLTQYHKFNRYSWSKGSQLLISIILLLKN